MLCHFYKNKINSFALFFAFYASFAFGFNAVDPFIIRKMSNATALAQGTC